MKKIILIVSIILVYLIYYFIFSQVKIEKIETFYNRVVITLDKYTFQEFSLHSDNKFVDKVYAKNQKLIFSLDTNLNKEENTFYMYDLFKKQNLKSKNGATFYFRNIIWEEYNKINNNINQLTSEKNKYTEKMEILLLKYNDLINSKNYKQCKDFYNTPEPKKIFLLVQIMKLIKFLQ